LSFTQRHREFSDFVVFQDGDVGGQKVRGFLARSQYL
jgi:hypothetical protein